MPLCSSNRPPNPSDGSTAVTAEGSGGGAQPVGAAGTSTPTSRSKNVGERSSIGEGEPDSPSWCRPSLGVFHTRTIFHLPRRSSSGYFSFESDSLPNSPLSPRPVTADIATQTPSLTGQVMQHALHRMAAEHGGGPGTQQQHGEHRHFAYITNNKPPVECAQMDEFPTAQSFCT